MTRRLNPAQQQAVTAQGSVAITAGAGTGKTFTLAHRYLHHITVDGLSPLSIAAMTFTDKAANELRSRIRALLRSSGLNDEIVAEVESAQISTIHSLCQRICRDFGHRVGISPDFIVQDEKFAPMWQQEKFDEAIGLIPKTSLGAIGYNWFASQLPSMMKDPLLTQEALLADHTDWQRHCDEESRIALSALLVSDEWQTAASLLPNVSGADDDTLEGYRRAIVLAMKELSDGGDILAFTNAFSRFNKKYGKGANWSGSDLADTRNAIGDLRDKCRSLEPMLSLSLNEYDTAIAQTLPHMRSAFQIVLDHIDAAKRTENLLDFNDLERFALEILAHHDIAAHYHERWRAIMVDEFQDTNPVQAKIIERLTPHAKLTLVGDEKQSIYGFRRADLSVFERFRSGIANQADGMIVHLETTFRTHRELVDRSHHLFRHMLTSEHQPLISGRTNAKLSGPYLRCFSVSDPDDDKGDSRGQQVVEARHIAAEIKRIHAENGIPYSEFAILTRQWRPLSTIQDVLSADGIPSVMVGGGDLLETREARDCYSMLGFLAEPHDDLPLVSVLRSPYFAVSDRVLFEIAQRKTSDHSWWSVIRSEPELTDASNLLKTLLEMPHISASDALLHAEHLTGYRAVTGNLPFPERRLADLDAIHDLCRSLSGHGRGDVFSVARYLRSAINAEIRIPRPPIDASAAVNLLTIHGSKGLEWDVVFVPALDSKRRNDTDQIVIDPEIGISMQTESDEYTKKTPAVFTLIRDRKKRRDLDEEKRLMYVAVTRAREAVILSTGKKGDASSAIAMLAPSLEAADIATEQVEYSSELARLPMPRPAEPIELPEHIHIDAIRNIPTELAVTSLAVYDRCPREFEYQILLGHPGLTTESGNAMEIGRIAHAAIETGRFEPSDLAFDFPDATQEVVDEAARLATSYRDDAAFASIRGDDVRYEVPFRDSFEGITFNGIADVVTENMVVDHKTDIEIHPGEHLIQLSLYARALGKPRAAIAYLRHSVLHEFSSKEISDTIESVRELIMRLKDGAMDARPTEHNCSRCRFAYICDQRFASI